MNASYHLVRPIEADLCRGCRLATFQALPVGQAAAVAIFCRRLDCDNAGTMPLEALPELPALDGPMPLGGSRESVLRRVWRSIADGVRSVW